MAIPNSYSALSTVFDVRTFLDEEDGFAHVRMEHAVADKASAIPDKDPNLPNLLRELHARGNYFRLLVFFPRTISSRRITFAGLKKCVPMTNSGRAVTDAISSMFRVDVLLARMAPGLHT